MRPTDTQCGLFAASKVLKKIWSNITYVENCWIEDRLWEEELRKFICTAQVVTAFKNLRIAQISVRPQRFMSVMVNEAELLEKFGIELVPLRGAVFVGTIKRIMQENQKEIDELVADIEKTIDMSRLKGQESCSGIGTWDYGGREKSISVMQSHVTAGIQFVQHLALRLVLCLVIYMTEVFLVPVRWIFMQRLRLLWRWLQQAIVVLHLPQI